MNMIKIYVTVTVADWFEVQIIELNTREFDFFSLESKSLLWSLHCWKWTSDKRQQLIQSHELAPSQNISHLVDELDIREIKSIYPHSNRTIKSLFTNYRKNPL